MAEKRTPIIWPFQRSLQRLGADPVATLTLFLVLAVTFAGNISHGRQVDKEIKRTHAASLRAGAGTQIELCVLLIEPPKRTTENVGACIADAEEQFRKNLREQDLQNIRVPPLVPVQIIAPGSGTPTTIPLPSPSPRPSPSRNQPAPTDQPDPEPTPTPTPSSDMCVQDFCVPPLVPLPLIGLGIGVLVWRGVNRRRKS